MLQFCSYYNFVGHTRFQTDKVTMTEVPKAMLSFLKKLPGLGDEAKRFKKDLKEIIKH